MALVTRAEYARIRGVTKAAITKAVATGRVDIVQTPQGERIDTNAADLTWSQRTDPTAQARSSASQVENTERRAAAAHRGAPLAQPQAKPLAKAPASDRSSPAPDPVDIPFGLTLTSERARHERIKIERAEMDMAERRGELVSREAIVSAWATKLIAAREALQTIPDRLAAMLAAETNPETVHRMLSAEIVATMSRLAEAPGASPT